MARIAVPLMIAFIALLIFTGWMVSTRRDRRAKAAAATKRELEQYEELVDAIYGIAHDAADIDPSAEFIIITIDQFTKKKKELL